MTNETATHPTVFALMECKSIKAAALLRMHRAYLNTTQAKEARRVGVDPSTYSLYESGSSCPALSYAARMQELYGIPAAHWAASS